MVNVIQFVLYITFAILSVISNSSVIYLVKRNKTLQIVPNYLICTLSVIDILHPLFMSVTVTLNKYTTEVKILCEFFGAINIANGAATIWMLVVICFNRYVALAKPLKVKLIFTTKRSAHIIITVCIVSISIAVLPWMGFGNYNNTSFSCVDFDGQVPYLILLTLHCFLVPMILLSVTYYKIYRIIKGVNNRKVADQNIVVKNDTNIQNESTTYNTSNTNYRFSKKERKLALMMFIIVMMYFCSWAPIAVSLFLCQKIPDLNKNKSEDILLYSYMVTYLNGILNPLIYFLMSENYNKAYRNMFIRT